MDTHSKTIVASQDSDGWYRIWDSAQYDTWIRCDTPVEVRQ